MTTTEMTDILGETARGEKVTRRDPSILPETVIYDVDLTLTLPVPLAVTSGLNAMAHAAEALYARDPRMVSTRAWHSASVRPPAISEIVAGLAQGFEGLRKQERLADRSHLRRKAELKTPLVGGQWRLKEGGGYDLVITENKTAPDIPAASKMQPIV
jgi:Iron-containing alcohol dehydrogenase